MMDRETIRLLVENPELRSRLYLAKNNVDFDVAFSLEQHEVLAWTIILGEMDGNVWDWERMQWRPPEK